ncbi:MAG: hypothetical protein V1723_02010 [Candidatus Uhrbacteria bacterium]
MQANVWPSLTHPAIPFAAEQIAPQAPQFCGRNSVVSQPSEGLALQSAYPA